MSSEARAFSNNLRARMQKFYVWYDAGSLGGLDSETITAVLPLLVQPHKGMAEAELKRRERK